MSENPEYNAMRHTYGRIKGTGVPVLFDSLPDFVAWSRQAGYLYGMKLRRLDPNLEYSPDNCVWVDVEKAKRYDLQRSLAKQWDEFITPIRERFREYLDNPPPPPEKPKATNTKEYFRYEHPDLQKEGIVWLPH